MLLIAAAVLILLLIAHLYVRTTTFLDLVAWNRKEIMETRREMRQILQDLSSDIDRQIQEVAKEMKKRGMD